MRTEKLVSSVYKVDVHGARLFSLSYKWQRVWGLDWQCILEAIRCQRSEARGWDARDERRLRKILGDQV